MIVFPNIKINLGLNVIAKRSDGYHALESAFLPVPWCDALEAVITDNQEFTFNSSGIPIPGSSGGNLVVKAYDLLKKDFSLPGMAVHLHKVIPMGAGLGGGSSDGAYMLKLINELCGLQLSAAALESYAARLGSDCPFFIRNAPSMVSGRGEILSPALISLQGYHIALVMPSVTVGTAEAYSWISPHPAQERIEDILRDPVNTWRNRLVNDFENPVAERYPVIAALRDQLYDLGAVYAAMSGSGAAVFGLFSTPPDLSHVDAATKFIAAL